MNSVRAAWTMIGAAALLVCGALLPHVVGADNSSYRQSIEKWRQAYEAELKSDSGWLTVSGLFWLHEGDNTFGSGSLNDIVLPASAPAEAGSFVFHAGKTIVHVKPDVAATLHGARIESAEMHPDSDADQLVLGNLTLYVHSSGERFTIRLRDKNSRLRKEFTGTRWFPVDESYRVVARYVPYDKPKQIQIQNVMGDTLEETIPGYAEFSLRGQQLRLAGEIDGSTLSIVFRDLTSGHETYGASRFLDAELPKDGKVILDFNQAYNPPCAYNPYTTCPLPPPENRLHVRIAAGEKTYHHAA
ncbi:MAG TPA: DUF1684 domain-containing protein [Candidatus Acidoferrales bacterium]|nr:DUF1684 domain-containing protein [Candidatus Acidoferrales bacterium]